MEAKDKEVLEKVQIKNTKSKKILIGTIISAMLLVLLILLMRDNTAQGTWELYSIEQGGNIKLGADIEAEYSGKVTYDLKDDGILIVTELGEEKEFTWSEEENTVYFYYSSVIKELVRDGDTMVLEENGCTYTYIR